MRRHLAAAALMIGALGMGLFAGCGDDDDTAGSTSAASTPTATAPGTAPATAPTAPASGEGPGELKIGVLVPLTGDLAAFGGPGAMAADLAESQINAAAQAAGVDLTVTLVQEDTETNANAAQQAATKLIESDDVSCIAGPWATSETIPVAENVTVDSGVPIISPSSTNPGVTEIEDNDLVFRTAPNDTLQGKLIAAKMAEVFGADATVVTASRNDAYGTGLVESFTTAWEAGGGTISRNVSYNPEATSLNSEAGQIVSGNPDAWMIVDFPDTWAKMGPALVRTGKWDPKRTFSSDGLRSTDLPTSTSRAATEGMRGTAPSALETPATTAFDALWKAEVMQDRQTYDASNFDAVVLCALAAVKAGSTDPADIAGAIRDVSGPDGETISFERLPDALTALAAGEDIDYDGGSGPIDLDENGDPGAGVYATWEYKGGELVDNPDATEVK